MKLNLLFLAGLLVGCGAAEEVDQTEPDYTEESELGELEQEYTSDNTNGILHGIKESASGTPVQCRTNMGVTERCFVPQVKSGRVYCVDPTSWTNSNERLTVRQSLLVNMNAMVAQIATWGTPAGDPGWFVALKPDGQACVAGDVVVFRSTLSPVLGENMGGYARFTVGQRTVLTESLSGIFERVIGGSIAIDKTDIDNRGANSTEDGFLLQHALAMGFANSLGIGHTGTGQIVATYPGVAGALQGFAELTNGQACRAAHFRLGNTTMYQTSNLTPACANE